MSHPCLISSPISSPSRGSGHCFECRLGRGPAGPTCQGGPISGPALQPQHTQLPGCWSHPFVRANYTLNQICRKQHACTHSKAWSCLLKNKFPPPSAPVLQLYQEQGWGWERKWSLHLSVLRQDNLRVTLHLACPGLVQAAAAVIPVWCSPAGHSASPPWEWVISGWTQHCRGWELGCSPTVPHYVFLHCFLCKLS